LLILAGVNLDNIEEKGGIGTDPLCSRLVTMGEPQIEQVSSSNQLGAEKDAVKWALDHGTFAKVLKTNARMFFRSVLPIIKQSFHYVDDKCLQQAEKRSREQAQLSDVASVPVIMDHAPSIYVYQSSIGALEIRRSSFLLEQSFAYFMWEALQSICKVHASAKQLCNDLESLKCNKDFLDKPTNNMFSRGIASKKGTSRAFKYLACFGLSCELRPAFGDDFEELIACHMMRYKQLLGYSTHRYFFMHRWPPKRNKNETLQQLEIILEARSFLTGIWKEIPKTKKHCIVLSQGMPTAQGGNVLVLNVDFDTKTANLNVDFDTKTANLETIQCKHYGSLPSKKTCLQWWNSLGVILEENGHANLSPEGDSSATYSYEGLKCFCDFVQKVLTDIHPLAEFDVEMGI
jgi:hypothetical protein